MTHQGTRLLHQPLVHQDIEMRFETVLLKGVLTMPSDAKGIILFVPGSGSSRLSPRTQWLAQELNQAGWATFLFDLLTLEEEEKLVEGGAWAHGQSDLLSQRLMKVTDWLQTYLEQEMEQVLPLGYFCTGSGIAAVFNLLLTDAIPVAAIVARGAYPEMDFSILSQIMTPTLFMVGGLDIHALELNRQAMGLMPEHTFKELVIIPDTGHLFEESDKLSHVAQYAMHWFEEYLPEESF